MCICGSPREGRGMDNHSFTWIIIHRTLKKNVTSTKVLWSSVPSAWDAEVQTARQCLPWVCWGGAGAQSLRCWSGRERRLPWAHRQAHLPNWMTPRTVRDPVSKREKKWWTASVLWARGCLLVSICAYVCVHTTTLIQTYVHTASRWLVNGNL